jgi:hypothetical protein
VHWWQSLVAEAAIVTLFVVSSAVIAWLVESATNQKRNKYKTTNNNQGESRESASKEESTASALKEKPYSANPINHTAEYKQTKPYAYTYLATQLFICVAAGVGIPVAIYSLRSLNNSVTAANSQAESAATQARLAFEAQRPFITFGDSAGKLVDYIPPQPGQPRGALILHFQNVGADAAPSVLINAVADNTPSVSFNPHHLLRYTYDVTFQSRNIRAEVGDRGLPIAAHTNFTVPLDDKWVPTGEQWKQIYGGHWFGEFSVWGTFEYCDSRGGYHCEGFDAGYRPPPIDIFTLRAPLPCFVGDPNIDEVPKEHRHNVHLLSRCAQPNERNPYEAQP